jgi:hypothetical protein
MTRILVCLVFPLFLASLLFPGRIHAAGAQSIIGRWSDNDENAYAFFKNNELTFQSKGQVNPVEGVWEYQEGICWLNPDKRLVGNIVIHIDTMECCINARILGSKLVLSEVWSKGYSSRGSDSCSNRVLMRRKQP